MVNTNDGDTSLLLIISWLILGGWDKRVIFINIKVEDAWGLAAALLL